MDLGQHMWTRERESVVANGEKHTSDKGFQRQNFGNSETQKITKTKIRSTLLVKGHSEDMTMIHHRYTADGPRNVHPHEPIVLICYWHVIHYKQETTWRQRLVTDTTHRGAAGDQTSSIITHDVVQSNHDINWTDVSIISEFPPAGLPAFNGRNWTGSFWLD